MRIGSISWEPLQNQLKNQKAAFFTISVLDDLLLQKLFIDMYKQWLSNYQKGILH